MIELIFLLIILILLITVYYYHYNKWYSFSKILKYPINKYKEHKEKEKSYKEKLRWILKLAENYLNKEIRWKYLNYTKYEDLKSKLIKVKESHKKQEYWKQIDTIIKEFQTCYNLINNNNFREKINKEFIKSEKIRCQNDYWNFLTEAQQEAIYTDEDAVLVNAWAWTGKTKTIENKIKYLVKEKDIPLDKILVVTFSKASQKDMMERICKTLENENIPHDKKALKKTITTFHAFWKWIIDDYENIYLRNSQQKEIWIWKYSKSVLEEEEKTKIVNKVLEEIKNDSQISELIKHYFFYYNKPIITEIERDENWNNNKIDKYTTFMKSWKWNVTVKSYWELLIANYLVSHGINAEYEPTDHHFKDNNDWNLKNYKPDFYIPISDNDWIYIEYFWVDKKNETAPWIDEEEYVENMNLKIKAHEKDHNKLIDIRYADLEEWRKYFIEKLENQLKKFWIDTSKQVAVDTTIIKYEMNNLWRLLTWFHALKCECWKEREEIIERIEKLPNREKERAYKFFEIFEAYYEKYKQYINKLGYMDFSDMITEARKYLNSWYVKRDYRYILVDEFQDISYARAELLNALIKDHNSTKLFCVWDDWQSIYKFTWSDLWIFLDFKRYFWEHSYLKLDKTFRFNQWISNLSWEFIMKNNFQKKKTLISNNQETKDKIKIFERDNLWYNNHDDNAYKNSILDILDDSIAHFSENEKTNFWEKHHEITCLYLTRYSLNKYEYSIFDMLNRKLKPKEEDWYNIYEINHKNYKFDLKIKHLTVHKSKGLEADYAIVDYVNRKWWYTFPSNIDDDPILELCMNQNNYSYPFAEERRVFYVAITRWKNKVYIIHDKNSESTFVRDIKVLIKWWKLSKDPKWAHCWKCWWDLELKLSKLHEYQCVNWCEWKYYEFEWKIYKAPICKCWEYLSILRTDWYKPYWPCESKKCRKYYKFRKNKFCIWKVTKN